MSKWFGWKFLEGNVQLAISEMKKSFPKMAKSQEKLISIDGRP